MRLFCAYLRSLMKRPRPWTNNGALDCNFISTLWQLWSLSGNSTGMFWCSKSFNWMLLHSLEDLGALGSSYITNWRLGILLWSIYSMLIHLLLILDEGLTSSFFGIRCPGRMRIPKILLLLDVLLQIIALMSYYWWDTANLRFICVQGFQRHDRWVFISA